MFGAPYTPNPDTMLTSERLLVGRLRGLSLQNLGSSVYWALAY